MAAGARSISERAAAGLRPGATGGVLASFERACDLVTDGGDVVALVWGGIGNGPLNVVLEDGPETAVPAGARFAVSRRIVAIGDWRVDLARAAAWDARPDWGALRAQREKIVAMTRPARHASQIAGLSWRSLLKQSGPAVEHATDRVTAAYCARHHEALRKAIAALCGLGPGLTPAGDDWLAGWLLALHLGKDLRGLRDLEGLVLEAASARTTTLSRAFLAAAAAGEAGEDWHALLAALAGGSQEQAEAAVARVLSQGATSGAAMLAGLLAGM